MEKKTYETPTLREHGSFESMTEFGGFGERRNPFGPIEALSKKGGFHGGNPCDWGS